MWPDYEYDDDTRVSCLDMEERPKPNEKIRHYIKPLKNLAIPPRRLSWFTSGFT